MDSQATQADDNLQISDDGMDKLSPSCRAHIIVFGNEKGGCGKSTSAMHVAIGLLGMGYKVGTIDLDARQATLTRYMARRFKFVTKTKEPLPSPIHIPIERSKADSLEARNTEEQTYLKMALEELGAQCDFIVIDMPGSDTNLSRLAHSYADTLVTPINDSFIDMDLLADIDPDTLEIIRPSVYTQMVQEQQLRKTRRDGRSFRWIVMRNRLSHIDAQNKRDVGKALDTIAENYGCLIAPGFGERVIFRELFLKGLTLLDLHEDSDNTLTLSQLSARQEVRKLILAIDPGGLKNTAQAR